MRMGVMMLMVATVTAIARPAGTRGYQHLQEQCVDRCSICFSSAIQRSVGPPFCEQRSFWEQHRVLPEV